MSNIPTDFKLESYAFELPEANIAQQPAPNRDASKLLALDKSSGNAEVDTFASIIDRIPEGSLLVVNNSKVLPARIFGTKETGGKVEFLLLTPLPLLMENISEQQDWLTADVEGLLRASKPPKPGHVITFSETFHLEVIERGEFGKSRVRLFWKGDLAGLFRDLGHYPLPPYIRRPDTQEDAKRYQTIYAEEEKLGSVAAPTAGLHFTPEIRKSLEAKGIEWAEVTLYVGYGTFSPVREEDIREHEMHKEYIEIPEATAQAVAKAKNEGRKVIAVGTTSVRTLEGAYKEVGDMTPFTGWTNIYIYPGYSFNIVDGCITNFHLPESSLIIMVSALAGRKNILSAYGKALENDFRFFSYGDAMLIT